MSMQVLAQEKSDSTSSGSTPRRGVLQRKCACGGSAGPSGECSACGRKRLKGGGRQAEQYLGAASDSLKKADSLIPTYLDTSQAFLPTRQIPDLRSNKAWGSSSRTAHVDRSVDTGFEPSMGQHHGYDFSRVGIHPNSARIQYTVLNHPHGALDARKTDENQEVNAPPPNGATTPDGINLGPTNATDKMCHKNFFATTSVLSNSVTSAQGRQDITFNGENSSQSDGLNCSCGCGIYRHWIKGYWRTGSATAPRRYDVTSCGHPLTINESTLSEEYTSCIGDNDADACRWAYTDAPGWSAGLADGMYVELHYEFVYQIWDQCVGRSVAAARRTLDISGSTAPRTIRWS